MPNFNVAYLNAFHEKIHVLIEQAYSSTRPKIRPNTLEVEITQYLVEAMNEKLQDSAMPEEFIPFFVRDNILIDDSDKVGKKRDLVDIFFEFAERGPRPHYFIEAKRLSRPGNNIGKYVGKDGLGCFINERYAKSWPIAGMLAYVQTDSIPFWIDKLEKNLGKPLLKCVNHSGKLIEEYHWTLSSLPSWVTIHTRSKEPIQIFHVFLVYN